MWYTKLLIFLGLQPVTDIHLAAWERERNVSMLVFALDRTTYRRRVHIIHILARLKDYNPKVIRKLARLARTDLLVVAVEAADLLKRLSTSVELVSRSTILRAIAAYEDRVRRRANKRGLITRYGSGRYRAAVPDKSRMKRLERVKEQLKKGIRLH